MKYYIRITIYVLCVLILCFILDIVSIFTLNKPLFAIKDNNDSINTIYKGILYDTYNCIEYSVPQIKLKWTKFSCSEKIQVGKIISMEDTTKEIKNFVCAEALESFYEDENHIYYWNCMKNDFMIVKYENGYEERISDALMFNRIKISDLNEYNINYIKTDK